MRKFLFIMTISMVALFIACGKGNDPIVTPEPVIPPVDGGTSGGTNGGTSGGTSYTNITRVINTAGAVVNYNITTAKITKTGSTHPDGAGIQTVDGGNVPFEIKGMTADNCTVTNEGDALEVVFKANADPVMVYVITNETAKTKTTVEIHFNKGSVPAHLIFQGNTTNAFKTAGITYDLNYIIEKTKSATQLVQIIQYDSNVAFSTPKIVGVTDLQGLFKKNADGSYTMTRFGVSNAYNQTADFEETGNVRLSYIPNASDATVSTYTDAGAVLIKFSNPINKAPTDVTLADTAKNAATGKGSFYFVASGIDEAKYGTKRLIIMPCKTPLRYSSEMTVITGLPVTASQSIILNAMGTSNAPRSFKTVLIYGVK